jgi:hypothetical protein
VLKFKAPRFGLELGSGIFGGGGIASLLPASLTLTAAAAAEAMLFEVSALAINT